MKSSVNTDQEIATAYHEAGHIVVAYFYDSLPDFCSIIPDNNGLVGIVKYSDVIPEHFKRYYCIDIDKKKYVEGRVATTLAGTCSHYIFDPEHIWDTGDQRDKNEAFKTVDYFASWAQDNKNEYLESCRNIAENILRNNWHLVSKLATKLLHCKMIYRDQIEEILNVKF